MDIQQFLKPLEPFLSDKRLVFLVGGVLSFCFGLFLKSLLSQKSHQRRQREWFERDETHEQSFSEKDRKVQLMAMASRPSFSVQEVLDHRDLIDDEKVFLLVKKFNLTEDQAKKSIVEAREVLKNQTIEIPRPKIPPESFRMSDWSVFSESEKKHFESDADLKSKIQQIFSDWDYGFFTEAEKLIEEMGSKSPADPVYLALVHKLSLLTVYQQGILSYNHLSKDRAIEAWEKVLSLSGISLPGPIEPASSVSHREAFAKLEPGIKDIVLNSICFMAVANKEKGNPGQTKRLVLRFKELHGG